MGMGPDFTMADFISNSAILTAIQPQHCAYGHSLDRPKVRKMADFTAQSAIEDNGDRRDSLHYNDSCG